MTDTPTLASDPLREAGPIAMHRGTHDDKHGFVGHRALRERNMPCTTRLIVF